MILTALEQDMRKLLCFFILLIIIFGAAPYFAGYYAKNNIENTFAQLDQKPQITVTEENYHQGWLTSTAQYTIKMNAPQHRGQATSDSLTSFTLSLDISHGPIIFRPSPLLALAQAKIHLDTSDKAPTTLPESSLVVHYNGSSTYMIGGADKTFLKYKDPTGSVQWDNMLLTMDFSRTFEQIEINGNLGQITIAGPDQAKITATPTTNAIPIININGGPIHASYTLADPYQFYVGGGDLTIQSVTSANEQIVKDLKINVDTKITDNELLLTGFTVELQEATVQSKKYGPGTFSFLVRNLDPKTLDKITSLVSQVSDAMYSQNPQEMIEKINNQPQVLALALFSKNAKFIQTMHMTTPQGNVEYNLDIDFPAYDPSHVLLQIPSLITQITAHLALELPKAYVNDIASVYALKKNEQAYTQMMIKSKIAQENGSNDVSDVEETDYSNVSKPQTPEQIIQKFVNKGLLVPQANAFNLQITYKDGKFIINGKQFDLETLNQIANELI